MSLPIVDGAALRAASSADDPVIRALRGACEEAGFLYVRDHGVDAQLCAEVFACARAFFALPPAAKGALDLDASPARHGYEPLLRQTLDASAPADLKEGFYVGRPSFGPNRWPLELPGMRATLESYFAAMMTLAASMLRALALSLELDADTFGSYCRDPLARLRLLHYPPQPRDAANGAKGAGAHTDYGGITILLQDDVGGLFVRDPDDADGWIEAPPIAGTFVVNLGDMIARWTNDRFRSTVHCVVNTSGAERYSIPFFFHGNPVETIACLPTCLRPGESPRYPAVTAAEHVRERLERSYATARGRQ